MSEEVIELSIQETNKLREKLGLTPLRGVPAAVSSSEASSTSEVLELSVDDTNELRAKLGLKPLKLLDGLQTGRTASEAFHKPAENDGAAKEMNARIERAKLEREVERNIQEKYSGGGLGDDGSDALSWAIKMRLAGKEEKLNKKKKRQSPKADTEGDRKAKENYTADDLKGMNVSHAASDFEAGSTVILTLADSSLLEKKQESNKIIGLKENSNELENVELSNVQHQKDGLRQKRQMELGMGRAGGYAGYDDDEFEELGGVSGPSNLSRGLLAGPNLSVTNASHRGFQIGQVEKEETTKNDIFSFLHGKAISLEPTANDVAATDFLSTEEYEASLAKKRKKDMTFKSKGKIRKREKKNKRQADDEDKGDDSGERPVEGSNSGKGLLADLERNAIELKPTKRRRREEDSEEQPDQPISSVLENFDKRSKYDKVMEKGNARAAVAFKSETNNSIIDNIEDDEPDDEFLQEALAKARRLRKLKEISMHGAKGADAVAQALQEANKNQKSREITNDVIFSVDETREFTRALRAREEQAERHKVKKALTIVQRDSSKPEESIVKEEPLDHMEEDDANMEELATEIKNEDSWLNGTTADVVPVGRGLSNVLSMLKHTGEIVGKNAKEEMRGRAKDKRTYEDYENLDLTKVVKIGNRATEKDLEFAKREIKLDYRDEHGRLLTRKEAYRNLCYQFHGHGSNKKNQERKLRQVEREQAEARLASRQVGEGKVGSGSLGALKATQRATGKAFVAHKTS